MAFWDGTKIIYAPDKPYPEYPKWLLTDCGCCGGLKWGVDGPVECSHCEGNGYLAKHIGSGSLALYPGGPFKGSDRLATQEAGE